MWKPNQNKLKKKNMKRNRLQIEVAIKSKNSFFKTFKEEKIMATFSKLIRILILVNTKWFERNDQDLKVLATGMVFCCTTGHTHMFTHMHTYKNAYTHMLTV